MDTVYFVIAIITAIVGGGTSYLTMKYGRIARLEQRVNELEKRDRAAWLYIQKSMQHQIKNNLKPLDLPAELV